MTDKAYPPRGPARPPAPGVTPAGLRKEQAAAFVGVSAAAWDKLWRSEQAPQPAAFSQRLLVWSRDELRAWLAQGCLPLDDWRRIWTRMLERGSWAAPDVVATTGLPGGTDAA